MTFLRCEWGLWVFPWPMNYFLSSHSALPGTHLSLLGIASRRPSPVPDIHPLS